MTAVLTGQRIDWLFVSCGVGGLVAAFSQEMAELSPSTTQRENLSQMLNIVGGNRKAAILAELLWEFFNYELYCAVGDDDGEANRHRIDLPKIVDGRPLGDVRVFLSIRRNARQEPGLVHELLHANVIRLGYPKFRIWEDPESDKWPLAEGITNNAEHVAMRPTFLSLGYSNDEFLGPSRALTNSEKQVVDYLESRAAELSTGEGYLTEVSGLLQSHQIRFEPVPVAAWITERKTARRDV